MKNKMIQYRLSGQKIKTIMKNPDRKEEGIAPNTLAVMKRNDTPKRKQEVWVMFQQKKSAVPGRAGKGQLSKATVISAWRYPGVSPKGNEIPIPDDILEDLSKENIL